MEICFLQQHCSPPPCDRWIEDDEAELKKLQENVISIEDTAVSWFEKNQGIDFIKTFTQAPREKLQELIGLIDAEREQLAKEQAGSALEVAAEANDVT